MTVLRYGSRGVVVVEVQALINAYLARESANITPFEIDRAKASPRADARRIDDVIKAGWVIGTDGDYGALTEAAVRLVQCNEDGITVDGIIGPMTRARLDNRPVEALHEEDPKANGLVIGGVVYPVPGHKVVGTHDAAWAHLAPGDSRKRPRKADGSLWWFVRQWIVHKTIADDPEILLPGKGPVGLGRRTAEYWQNDGRYGGAQIVFADDGEIDQLADLYDVEAFHATRSNPYSTGSEMREVGPRAGEKGGKFYEATLRANTAAILVGAPKLGIQLQSHVGPYRGVPLVRMDDDGPTPGGPDVCGILDHKWNTDQRGMWDAGAMWLHHPQFGLLANCPGFELFDYTRNEDLTAWKDRQSDLVRAGHKIAITGVPGPDTCEALKREGYIDGIYALGKAAA